MSPTRRSLLLLLFFVSGFAGLVYEVLWLRQLGLLFGNTAYATSTTLAVFFLGQSAGQRCFGSYAHRLPNPLRAYAVLELGIAVAAAAYFVLLPAYRWLYPDLFALLADAPLVFAVAKGALSIGILFPPAFLMGATLPVLSQLLVHRWSELAPTVSLLYGSNTLGGALGALAAGFSLPLLLGFRNTYLGAMASSVAVAAIAYGLSQSSPLEGAQGESVRPPRGLTGVAAPALAMRWLSAALAFGSGLLTLGLEVLWTRMFAQVLHNSVYSFAAILVTFLVALGLGSFVAHRLSRIRRPPTQPLFFLLLLSGLSVAGSPFLFDYLTDGVAYLGPRQGWWGYVGLVFGSAAGVMLLPGIIIGSVFPYLLKLSEGLAATPGGVVGRLASLNTVGSVAGSLIAGFLLLPHLGLWASIRAIAVGYLVIATAVGMAARQLHPFFRLAPLLGLLLVFSILDPTHLPLVDLQPGREALREVWESEHGTVAVVQEGQVLQIKVDNSYSIGASGSLVNDRRLGDLPLLLHPSPRTVFFLGMGTGITAGAALFHPLEQVTTCELIPEVAAAAEKYFSPYVNGLFTDPRSRIVLADARNYLLGTRERFDVIISDLFVPWHTGTTSLYSREHFTAVRDRLNEGGLFALWLPLYQLSLREFSIIGRTMLDVFPSVTLWRGDFLPATPVVAMVGHESPTILNPATVVSNVRARAGGAGYPEEAAKAMLLLFYAGNLSQARTLFASSPVNTDDRPEIEYLAPVTQREVHEGKSDWLTGTRLVRFYAQLASVAPPENDPFLAASKQEGIAYVRAGRHLYEASVDKFTGKIDDARSEWEAFSRLVPHDVEAKFHGLWNDE